MKIWKKIRVKSKDKQIDIVAHSLTNYLFKYGPISDIISKYKIESNDVKIMNEYTTNRIAGLFLLYVAKDTKRINDILNKYNKKDIKQVTPEVEGYVEK
ncbi:MAG: hypothetical protein HFJ12_05340 [Bacilli bacterium]|nr:hypothetical protein [Bacilli bacterium]